MCFRREIKADGANAQRCRELLKWHLERVEWSRQTIENAKRIARESWESRDLTPAELLAESFDVSNTESS